MRFWDLVTMSLRNIARQKMRSILTIFSIMVGAFLILIMMSVGEGLESFLMSQVTSFTDNQTISVSKNLDMGSMFGFGGQPKEYDENQSKLDFTDTTQLLAQRYLTKKDLDSIKKIDGVEDAGFQLIISADYIQLDTKDSKKFNINIYGFPNGLTKNFKYYDVNYDLFNEENFIVLSGDYAELWGLTNDDIVGQKILVQIPKNSSVQNIQKQSKIFEFIVAGVTEKSLIGQMGMIGTDAAYEIGAYKKDITVKEYTENLKDFEIVVEVENEDQVESVVSELKAMDYRALTLEDTLGQIGIVFDIIGYILSGFGGIALLVASIGIVNTLLMAIYERTREIGVMMAVGAKNVFIGIMFTFEGALLGFIGGSLGVLSGWGFGVLANNILHNGITVGGSVVLEAYLKDYPTYNVSIITPTLVGFVIITTTMVAWIASLYPAWKASRLDPIKALRYD